MLFFSLFYVTLNPRHTQLDRLQPIDDGIFLSGKPQVDISVRKGTHQSEHAVNKQLNDKERVAAALENSHLLEVVNQCLATATSGGVVANIVKGPAIVN